MCLQSDGSLEQSIANDSASWESISISASNKTTVPPLLQELESLKDSAMATKGAFLTLLFMSTLRAASLLGYVSSFCTKRKALLGVARMTFLGLSLAAASAVLGLHVYVDVQVHGGTNAENAPVETAYSPMFSASVLIVLLLIGPGILYGLRTMRGWSFGNVWDIVTAPADRWRGKSRQTS